MQEGVIFLVIYVLVNLNMYLSTRDMWRLDDARLGVYTVLL